jgi:FtsH-binding integral membrane protein
MSNSILDAFGQGKTYDESKPMARTFVANVFAYMFAGLVISGIVSWVFANTPSLWIKLINIETGGLSPLGWVIMFAPIGVSLIINGSHCRFVHSLCCADRNELMLYLFSLHWCFDPNNIPNLWGYVWRNGGAWLYY